MFSKIFIPTFCLSLFLQNTAYANGFVMKAGIDLAAFSTSIWNAVSAGNARDDMEEMWGVAQIPDVAEASDMISEMRWAVVANFLPAILNAGSIASALLYLRFKRDLRPAPLLGDNNL